MSRITDRNEWYDKNSKLPHPGQDTIVAPKKAAGTLADGYSKLSIPEDKSKRHVQLTSTRDNVGSRWRPGPGKQHSGKASPAGHDSVKVKEGKKTS